MADLNGFTVKGIKERVSMIGTPVVMPMKFDDYWLPVEPLVTISRKKKIIETELDYVEGSFKEGFSNGDYDITIQGVILDEETLEPEFYPEKQLRIMRKLLNRTVNRDADGNISKGIGNIKVSHQLLNSMGIYYIVIYDYSLPQVPGQNTIQNYTLTCKSDVNRDLLINKP